MACGGRGAARAAARDAPACAAGSRRAARAPAAPPPRRCAQPCRHAGSCGGLCLWRAIASVRLACRSSVETTGTSAPTRRRISSSRSPSPSSVVSVTIAPLRARRMPSRRPSPLDTVHRRLDARHRRQLAQGVVSAAMAHTVRQPSRSATSRKPCSSLFVRASRNVVAVAQHVRAWRKRRDRSAAVRTCWSRASPGRSECARSWWVVVRRSIRHSDGGELAASSNPSKGPHARHAPAYSDAAADGRDAERAARATL